MLLKIAKMFSTISHFEAHMRNAIETAQLDGRAEPSWQMVQPIVGKTLKVTFNDDERMLAVTELPKAYINFLQLADVHRGLTELFEEYSSQRVELGSLMPTLFADGMVATTELTREEHGRLIP